MDVEPVIHKLRSQELKAEELTHIIFEKIARVEDKVHAFVTLCKEQALMKAKEVDRKIMNGEMVGKLAGIPVVIKDNICTQGIRTTCSSRMLENFIPPYDATVMESVKSQGVRVGPKAEYSLDEPMANSSMFVFPMNNAPSFFILSITVAS